jgi:hypothetical protein
MTDSKAEEALDRCRGYVQLATKMVAIAFALGSAQAGFKVHASPLHDAWVVVLGEKSLTIKMGKESDTLLLSPVISSGSLANGDSMEVKADEVVPAIVKMLDP